MEKLNYEIKIKASKKIVWETLIDKEKFKTWSKAFSPNSDFKGKWEEGAEILFIDVGKGGTVARLDKFKPFDVISATHIATLTKDLTRETTGEFTEKWIGTKETYWLEESDGSTTLKIEMESDEEFTKMFEDSWPEALENIKKLAESAAYETEGKRFGRQSI